MTRTTNARLAGLAFLFYIAVGITSMVVFGRATAGAEGAVAKLAAIAQQAGLVRVTVLFTMLEAACAVVLAVTLYALTREIDADLAMLAMCCRLTEGVIGIVAADSSLQLLSVATASVASTPDATVAQSLGALLLQQRGLGVPITATCFAVGSTIFSYLFLRARSIPVWLAWLGVFASALLVVMLPAQILAGEGLLTGIFAWLPWIPMLVFEVVLALWLIIKGVAVPLPR